MKNTYFTMPPPLCESIACDGLVSVRNRAASEGFVCPAMFRSVTSCARWPRCRRSSTPQVRARSLVAAPLGSRRHSLARTSLACASFLPRALPVSPSLPLAASLPHLCESPLSQLLRFNSIRVRCRAPALSCSCDEIHVHAG
eukprot:5849925-Pleurochrysis_carterae.AAC.1